MDQDGREHGRQVEARIDGLANLSQHLEFLDRSLELTALVLQLLQEPIVLDRQRQLLGDRIQQLEITLGVGAWCPVIQEEEPNRLVAREQRQHQRRAHALLDHERIVRERVFLLSHEIADESRPAFGEHPSASRAFCARPRLSFPRGERGISHG